MVRGADEQRQNHGGLHGSSITFCLKSKAHTEHTTRGRRLCVAFHSYSTQARCVALSILHGLSMYSPPRVHECLPWGDQGSGQGSGNDESLEALAELVLQQRYGSMQQDLRLMIWSCTVPIIS